MATDAQTLITAAQCYDCNGSPGQWQLLKLGLLKQILLALNPMADTSAQALLNSVSCYACLSPGLWQLLELALLQQMVTTGAGGGLIGVVDPNGNVIGNPGQTYVNTAAQSFWIKESGTGTNTGWVQFL